MQVKVNTLQGSRSIYNLCTMRFRGGGIQYITRFNEYSDYKKNLPIYHVVKSMHFETAQEHLTI